MNTQDVKEIVEKEYNLDIQRIEKIKNVFKLNSSSGEFCLKLIHYEFEHFYFILSAIKHLQRNQFQKIPEIIKTKNNNDYILLGSKYAYLTNWINGRLCNYDNPLDVSMAALKLAELHKKSRNFIVTKDMKPRIGWLKWIETYKTRRNEILDFKNRIDKKSNKTEFDMLYLSVMNQELERAESSINHLIKSDYMNKMKEEILNRGFCHHDYAHHNVLIDKENSLNIIDFDYCILDTHLHDLSSILIRTMKYGRWDMKKAKDIFNVYSSLIWIHKEDLPIISAFIEFPQDYWQRGIQCYWEEKDWGEEFFVKKLEKYIEDREHRSEFVKELRGSF